MELEENHEQENRRRAHEQLGTFVRLRGGSRVIRKVLIANNGRKSNRLYKTLFCLA